MMLKNFFTEDVIVDNHALNGRSSKSFISEGHWQKVVEKIKPGDYVFIQFGHNDEKDDPKRHTDPGTTFDENLRKFVKETRMRGGIPVLFNSVVRRIFTNSKTAVADDDTRSNSSADLVEGDTLVDTHGDYLLSPRNVARELDVPFVDANKITHDLEQGLGPDKSKKLHMWYLPNEVPSLPKGRQDNTHYNVYGAYVVAGLLADAVSDAVPELKQYRCKYVRWCGVAQRDLGEGWHVIEEGLNGRTTVRDDMCHLDTNLNGIRALPMLLEAHKPLDAIVIMLGTNDCKTVFNVTASDIARGAMALIRAVRAFPWTDAAPCPRILLMAPIKIKPQIADVYMTDFDEHSVEASEHFGEYYAHVAEQFGCDFLNAAEFAEPGDIDYLHMMPESHESLGHAVAAKLKEMLGE